VQRRDRVDGLVTDGHRGVGVPGDGMGAGQIRQVLRPDTGVVGAEAVHALAQQEHRLPGGTRVAAGQGQPVVGRALGGREKASVKVRAPRWAAGRVDNAELLGSLAQCALAARRVAR
jgi:hypothetical protein